MTDTEIRIAIAEACPEVFIVFKGQGRVYWKSATRGISSQPVDILDDLNAMHEAEKWLRGTSYQYCNDPVVHRRWREYEALLKRFGVHITARQRAEAFLRTLNLWKE